MPRKQLSSNELCPAAWRGLVGRSRPAGWPVRCERGAAEVGWAGRRGGVERNNRSRHAAGSEMLQIFYM
eukprot:6207215-Pleurochrysis_carterae.AAC.3